MIELLQFRHSPYNEKVRWALDLKRVPHRRRSLLPGPHLPVVKKLTGRSSTPVLLRDGEPPLDGSARILDWLDERYPSPPLTPADAGRRAEAERIERRFDDDLTPRIRVVVLDALLAEPTSFARVFGDGRPGWQQRLYALIVPLAAPLVRKGNGIGGPETLADGHAAIAEALDFAAQSTTATGFVVGDAFSRADVTVASTLAMIVRPPDSPVAIPPGIGAATRALIDRYAAHPGADWVRRTYRRHRGASRDFDGIAR